MKKKLFFITIGISSLFIISFMGVSCDKYKNRIWFFIYNYSDMDFDVHIFNSRNSFLFPIEKKTYLTKNAYKIKGKIDYDSFELEIELIDNGEKIERKSVSFLNNGITSFCAYGGIFLGLSIVNTENDGYELIVSQSDFPFGSIKNGNAGHKNEF